MNRPRSNRPLKVGALARRTGISVRTLHYYEEIGLLVPSYRTDAGHRLYSANDVVRLQQIKSLRVLGFTLDEVRECLRSPCYSPIAVLDEHLARAREQMILQGRVVERLSRLVDHLRESGDVNIDEFLSTIEVMTMWEDKITSEQRTEVQARGKALGAERVRTIENGWLRAIEDLRVEMERGTDPMSDRVQALIARNRELTREFCGESAVVESVLYEAYREGAGAAFGLDAALREYIARATH
jgi:DNA-binding transcriptional MerR regulator